MKNDEESLFELFLTTGQTTKIRNAVTKNMWTDINLSKAHISKIIQPDESFGSFLGNLGKKVITDLGIPLARDNLPSII